MKKKVFWTEGIEKLAIAAGVDNGVVEFSGYSINSVRVDGQLSFELVRWPRLRGLHAFSVQTLQQPAEGTVYVHGSDHVKARYLPGRNVVIVEAESLDGLRKAAAVMQVADFHAWAASHAANMAAGLRGWEAFDSLYVGSDCPWVVTILRDDR